MGQKRLRKFKKSRLPLTQKPSVRRPFHLGSELRILFANRGVRIYTAVVVCVLATLLTMAAGQLASFLKISLIEDLAKYQIPFAGTTQPITDLPVYNPSNLNQKIYSTAYLGNYFSFNGKEIVPSIEGRGSHPGVDIVLPTGTPVKAIADGLVIVAKESSNGFGKQVLIGHPNVPDPVSPQQTTNLFSVYAHLSEILTTEGVVIKKGELIGRVGQTGIATTSHLHFQIDRETAFFHPYWPFNNSDMAAAGGVSFTQAVTIGLGAEKARQNTVNPMIYVQTYANFTTGTQTGTQLAAAATQTAQFVDFKLVDAQTLTAKLTQQLTLAAVGSDNQILTDFVPQDDVRVIVPSERAMEGTIIIRPGLFQNGQATFAITPLGSGDLSLTVRYGDLRTILTPITVLGGAVTVPAQTVAAASQPASTPIVTVANDIELKPPVAPEKPETGQAPWQLFSLDYITPLIMSQHYRLTLSTQDERGTINHQYVPAAPIKLELTDPMAGLLGPKELAVTDFSDGRATVNFTPVKSGNLIMRASDGVNAYIFTLEVHHPKELEPNHLAIEHGGQAKTGETTAITFRALNSFDTLVPNYKPASFTLSTSDPHGLFNSPSLTAADFAEGMAMANYIPTIPGETLISATDGSLSATSDVLRVSGEPLVVTTSLNPATPAVNLAADFPDVPLAHPNAAAIYELKKRGIIKGYEDGTFQPGRPVARVEILKILLTGFNKPVDQNTRSTDFADVPSGTWYPPFVAAGKQLGIIKGYEDGSFRPQKTVSRIESLKMLFVTQNITPPETVERQPYPDIPLGNWYTGYVSKASALNLVDTYTGNLFYPNEGMTRSEVAELIYRLLYVQEKGVAQYPKA